MRDALGVMFMVLFFVGFFKGLYNGKRKFRKRRPPKFFRGSD